jgi:hypothetical protein
VRTRRTFPLVLSRPSALGRAHSVRIYSSDGTGTLETQTAALPKKFQSRPDNQTDNQTLSPGSKPIVNCLLSSEMTVFIGVLLIAG